MGTSPSACQTAAMRQYEIWWAQLPLPAGRRPVLLLSRTAAYEYLERVTACEISSSIRNIPQEVRVGTAEGLRGPSAASLDNLHVVDKGKLRTRIGALAPSREREVKRALGYALDWVELKCDD
jgi:mRNA interferase MazF